MMLLKTKTFHTSNQLSIPWMRTTRSQTSCSCILPPTRQFPYLWEKRLNQSDYADDRNTC